MLRIIGENNQVLKEYPHITCYCGNLPSGSVALKEGQYLVAVWFDGEPNFYVADGEVGIKEVKQKYLDDWGDSYTGHVGPVHVFKQVEYAGLAYSRPILVKR